MDREVMMRRAEKEIFSESEVGVKVDVKNILPMRSMISGNFNAIRSVIIAPLSFILKTSR